MDKIHHIAQEYKHLTNISVDTLSCSVFLMYIYYLNTNGTINTALPSTSWQWVKWIRQPASILYSSAGLWTWPDTASLLLTKLVASTQLHSLCLILLHEPVGFVAVLANMLC